MADRDYLLLNEIEDVLSRELSAKDTKELMRLFYAEAKTCLCHATEASECICGVWDYDEY